MANQNKNLEDDLALAADSQKMSADSANGAKEYLSSNGDKPAAKDENVILAKSKIVLAKKLLNNVKENSERLLELLAGSLRAEDEAAISIGQLSDEGFETREGSLGEQRTIEGVFDGENMIGPDGKQYSVPANYASKSKLVEGDILKLTITSSGTFVYKQIGPIERARVVGVLERSATGEYLALADGKRWRLLTASVTYYKGESGDEVVVLVPKNGESKWAAVENIVRANK
ncbi:MAG: 50S ribosomal protein L7/L12 [Parcubacteria group bacterium GW2011_GWC2_42_12]|nr:MAG: 50S ribosomal protein L7/L12 [Parcubacteria group bacterium GW2011_GWC2_42_12]